MALTGLLLGALLWRLGTWRQDHGEAWALCARHSGPFGAPARLEGTLGKSAEGRWELRAVTVGESRRPFRGAVVLPGPVTDSPGNGARAREGTAVGIEGTVFCGVPLNNPARLDDGGTQWELPRLRVDRNATVAAIPGKTDPVAWGAAAFGRYIDDSLGAYPAARALARSAWLGDSSGLSREMRQWYEEAGLLPILALSGQHVVILATLAGSLLGWAARGLFLFPAAAPGAFGILRVRAALPIVAAVVLTFTSQGTASMVRTLAMALALAVLRWRRLEASAVQLAATAAALAVVMDPSLISRPGFILSAGTTAILLELVGRGTSGARIVDYGFLAVAMPLAASPLIAFYFGRVSLAAPLTGAILGGIWGVVILPVAFLLPLGAALPGAFAPALLGAVEKAWSVFARWHGPWRELVEKSYRVVPRPIVAEGIALEIVAVGALVFASGLLRPPLRERIAFFRGKE